MKKYLKDMDYKEIVERLIRGEKVIEERNEDYYLFDDKLKTINYYEKQGNLYHINVNLAIQRSLYFEVEEPLEIKDAGLYKTKNGKQVYVSLIYYDCVVSKVYCKGVFKDEDNIETWNKDGTYTDRNLNQFDIVSKWEE